MTNLSDLIAQSVATVKTMTPAERKAMLAEQARGYAIAEAGMGSDAQEAEYAAALRSGDAAAIARCEAAAQARMDFARRVCDDHRY